MQDFGVRKPRKISQAAEEHAYSSHREVKRRQGINLHICPESKGQVQDAFEDNID